MKNQWSDWEVMRRQVAVCGRVVADGAPVVAGDVRIEGTRIQTPEVVSTRADGIYFFLDLPAGTYGVTAEDARGKRRGEGAGSVSWNAGGDVQKAVLDITALPTAPAGTVRVSTRKGRSQ